MSEENKEVSLLSSEESKLQPDLDSSIVEGGFDIDFSDIESSQETSKAEVKPKKEEETLKTETPKVEQIPATDVNDKLMDALNEVERTPEVPVKKEEPKDEVKEEKKEEESPTLKQEQKTKKKESKKEKTDDSDIILETDLKNSESSPEVIAKDLDDEELTEFEKKAQKEIQKLSDQTEKITGELEDLYQERRNVTFDDNVSEDSEAPDVVIEEKGKKIKVEKKSDTYEDKIAKKEKELQDVVDKAIKASEKFQYYGGEIEGSFPSFVSSQNKILKNFSKKNIPAEKIQTTTRANDPENEELFIKQYITQESASSSPVVAPRITRVPMILSGYYVELKNFTYTEMADYARKIQEPNITFKEKLIRELDAIYSHIVWTSFMKRGEVLNYDEFLSKTKFGDYLQLHFGMYDASFPGTTSWTITCSRCKHQFLIQKTSKQLCYLLNNRNDTVLSDKFLHDVLIQKVSVNEMKNTRIYQFANSMYSDKVIYPNNIKVGYESPSMVDILETLDILEESYSTDFPDTGDIMDSNKPNYTILLLLCSIHKLWVPLVAGQDKDGKNIIRFHELDATFKGNTEAHVDERVKARKYIIATLMSLPEEQFAELFTGRDVRLRVKAEGIRHFINNIECPNCGSRIGNIPIDMRDSFFGRTTEIAQSTNSMM
ncbi:MAG: hypothetical protein IJ772_04525 [Bacilli bacterium]|nr:hypothetical protein [Bacilli bacterium]